MERKTWICASITEDLCDLAMMEREGERKERRERERKGMREGKHIMYETQFCLYLMKPHWLIIGTL